MRAQQWCKLPVIATILLGGCGIDTVRFELGSPKTENDLGQPRLDSPDAALSVPVWERPVPEDETEVDAADEIPDAMKTR
jgi:hypothetical protein